MQVVAVGWMVVDVMVMVMQGGDDDNGSDGDCREVVMDGEW